MEKENKLYYLFFILNHLNKKEFQIAKQCIEEELQKETSHLFDIGVALYVIGEYCRHSKDLRFVEEHEKEIEVLIQQYHFIFEKDEAHPIDQDMKGIWISCLGALYGGLRSINNYLSRQDIGLNIRVIRKYIFEQCIRKGRVVNPFCTSEITADILLACNPFGLFEPEDLVLVETVSELEKKIAICGTLMDQLLLANYFVEQGSYHKAAELLTKSTDLVDATEKMIYQVVHYKLKEKVSINEQDILHHPFGNNNPYLPKAYERFPKIPCEGDSVEIFAQSSQLEKEEKLHLRLRRNGTETIIESQIKDKLETSYYWKIGPFSRDDVISYSLFREDNQRGIIETEAFQVSIYKKEQIQIIDVSKVDEKCIELTCETKSSYPFKLFLEVDSKKHFKLTTECSAKSTLKELALFDVQNSCLIELEAGYKIKVSQHPSSIQIEKNDATVIVDGVELVYHETEGIKRIECTILKQDKEGFYGFGERYNALNQQGNCVDNYVYNQYKDQGIRTYMPIPFYLSDANYGCFLESSHYSYFDVGKTKQKQIKVSNEDSKLILHFFFGKFDEVIHQYTDLTGKPKLLPKWAFGPWMSSNNWDNQEEVNKQMQLTKEYKIPSTVFVIEAWSDEVSYYIFNDSFYKQKEGKEAFKYDDFEFPSWGRWPNPKEMVKQMHDTGMKCILWQIPILKELSTINHLQKEQDEQYAITEEYVVQNDDGTPYRISEGWFKDSLVLDFTNPEAKKWWFEKRKYLVEALKVDGFKTDGGECIFGKELKFFDGRRGDEMRNAYSNSYIGAYYDFINTLHPDGGITFSRSGFTGAQNFPAHWAGDERSTFDAFKRSLCAALSSGLSGIAFWGWDFAGFSGDVPTDELYIRSAAMAAFCPIMQYHAESKGEFNQDRTPWNIAERSKNPSVIKDYRYFANLRMNLIPYIYQEATYVSKTGEPLMRAMLIDYSKDEKAAERFDQYLFGRSLLVAPIIEEGSTTREVYLPKGIWYDFFTGKRWDGNLSLKIEAQIHEIPVFIKDDSVIALAFNECMALGIYTGNEVDEYEVLGFIVVGNIESYSLIISENEKVTIDKKDNMISLSGSTKKKMIFFTTDKDIVINEKMSHSNKKNAHYWVHEVH